MQIKGVNGMPSKLCKHPGCNKLNCTVHKPKEFRASAAKRGYDSRWRKYRSDFLQAHPLCAECQRNNRVTLATVVDHVIPHKGDKALFWDIRNHEALCTKCHNRKTAKEDMGSWDTYKGIQ